MTQETLRSFEPIQYAYWYQEKLMVRAIVDGYFGLYSFLAEDTDELFSFIEESGYTLVDYYNEIFYPVYLVELTGGNTNDRNNDNQQAGERKKKACPIRKRSARTVATSDRPWRDNCCQLRPGQYVHIRRNRERSNQLFQDWL